MAGVKLEILVAWCLVLGAGFWALGAGCSVLGARCWVLGAGAGCGEN